MVKKESRTSNKLREKTQIEDFLSGAVIYDPNTAVILTWSGAVTEEETELKPN